MTSSRSNPAFASTAFAATNAQSISGQTTVIAHSLGNMVVCSAIQGHGFRPNRYFMLTAAVPAQAFDITQWNTKLEQSPLPWYGQLCDEIAANCYNIFPHKREFPVKFWNSNVQGRRLSARDNSHAKSAKFAKISSEETSRTSRTSRENK